MCDEMRISVGLSKHLTEWGTINNLLSLFDFDLSRNIRCISVKNKKSFCYICQELVSILMIAVLCYFTIIVLLL